MLTMKPVRRQGDGLNEEVSAMTGLDPVGKDRTRQEFDAETDINVMLKRHGVGVRPLVFGEADYDLDLQRSLDAIHQARAAYNAAPAKVKDLYPNWRAMLNAVENGTFKADLLADDEPVTERSTPSPTDEGGVT